MMPLKELRRLWGVRKQSVTGSGGEDGGMTSGGEEGGEKEGGGGRGGTCALPLLQVWPSQDSPRGEADGQSFIFVSEEQAAAGNALVHNASSRADSGIDSVQASPCCAPAEKESSPTTAGRRPSTSLLHPNHARLQLRRPSSPENHSSIDEEFPPCNGSKSSSTASSMTSVAAGAGGSHRLSDPWERERDRRRSSTITARYSLLDALDLEYALLRAAARGSVGPYSLSESLHKLTFTQSLAFPALARGLASKRRPSQTQAAPLDPNDSGLNAFARIVTALVLMLVSVMVFGVVYKFVRT